MGRGFWGHQLSKDAGVVCLVSAGTWSRKDQSLGWLFLALLCLGCSKHCHRHLKPTKVVRF